VAPTGTGICKREKKKRRSWKSVKGSGVREPPARVGRLGKKRKTRGAGAENNRRSGSRAIFKRGPAN